jgi:chemotaxis protein methyltransferase CheR
LDEFLDKITINVSEFFRNRKRWEILEKKILPGLLKENRNLRIWSAACATGEEPYTMALILSKFIPLSRIRIFATDIDEKAIATARLGIYPERSLEEVPDELKKRYFVREGNLYKLSEDIKSTVIFKKHNLLADPYGGPYDLIICRNVLIYFTDEAKEMIYKKISNALTIGGILFVGSTEQIFNASRYGLAGVDTFFYQKLPV